MSSVATLFFGQAGLQVASAVWELITAEHGIYPNGFKAFHDSDNCLSFFSQQSTGKMIPQCIQVDTEPTVMDEIRTGTYGKLFHPKYLINDIEDSANLVPVGRYQRFHTLGDRIMEALRLLAENTDNLQTVLVMHSLGGGTGAGLGSRILQELTYQFPKMNRIVANIFPSSHMSPIVVEPYNSVLSCFYELDNTDLNMLFDNESLYQRCDKNLSISNTNHPAINRLIAEVIGGVTGPMRMGGSLSCNLVQSQVNLVPYPRIHFPLTTFAPLCQATNANDVTVKELVTDTFKGSSTLVQVRPLHEGVFMSSMLFFRGCMSMVQIYDAVKSIRLPTFGNFLEFADWCPTAFKLSHTAVPALSINSHKCIARDKSVTTLINNTVVTDMFHRMLHKYETLYQKKAFLHWFIASGIEEDEFEDAHDSISNIIGDYETVAPMSDRQSQKCNHKKVNRKAVFKKKVIKFKLDQRLPPSDFDSACLVSDLKQNAWQSFPKHSDTDQSTKRNQLLSQSISGDISQFPVDTFKLMDSAWFGPSSENTPKHFDIENNPFFKKDFQLIADKAPQGLQNDDSTETVDKPSDPLKQDSHRPVNKNENIFEERNTEDEDLSNLSQQSYHDSDEKPVHTQTRDWTTDAEVEYGVNVADDEEEKLEAEDEAETFGYYGYQPSADNFLSSWM